MKTIWSRTPRRSRESLANIILSLFVLELVDRNLLLFGLGFDRRPELFRYLAQHYW